MLAIVSATPQTASPPLPLVFALGALLGLAAGGAIVWLYTRRRSAPSSVPAAPAVGSPAPQLPAETPVHGETPPHVAMRLIELRDQVLSTHAHSETPNVWLYDRLGTVLESLGVMPIESGGAVDYDRAEAVGTKSTADPALADTIASTVRPGYVFNGVTVRPQQVIVYVKRP